jgi:NAD(P) transhydrogenase subunit alpha
MLHTPLMSVTNAISSIVIIGAILQVSSEQILVQILSLAAVALTSINMFGGFAVTDRMLKMFKK